MTTGEQPSRSVGLLPWMGCAVAGLLVGWSFTPRDDETARGARDSDVREPPRGELEVLANAHDESCDRVRSELADIRREQELLDRRIQLRQMERTIGTAESGWPRDVANGMMPSVFEETVLDLGEQLGVTVDDVDCAEYPCFAVLAEATSESDFDALREKLDSRCGTALAHYGAVRFHGDGKASYAVACVPSGESEEIDELKDGLRERAFERLRQAVASKPP